MALSSFQKAFKEAREKGETEFEFGGKKYNTKYKEEVKTSAKPAAAKPAAPVKEAAPAKSLAMPDTDRDLSRKVKEEEKPFSEYRFGPQNIKRNLLNAPSDISDLVSSPFRAIREAGNRGNPDAPKKMASGGNVSSASKRADGIAQKGKTRGKMC
jgi:hypothetical protein